MNRLFAFLSIPVVLSAASCAKQPAVDTPITPETVQRTVDALVANHGEGLRSRAERGVAQTATLWRSADGTVADFEAFCQQRFVADETARRVLFDKLSNGLEHLYGYAIMLSKDLQRPVHLAGDELTDIDGRFAAFDTQAHLSDELFANQIGFIAALNFPAYTLVEKQQLGGNWTRLDWAYARMGDLFSSRVPAAQQQTYTAANAAADAYISEYNINLGYLLDTDGSRPFPEDLTLISHWGLRDEIKAQYANANGGLARQQLIYEVMLRIIDQSIPQQVINSKQYLWNPRTNTIEAQGQSVRATSEPNTRYQHLLNQFHAQLTIDAYTPDKPTFIQRQFDGNLELTVDEVERLFIELVSSAEVRQLAGIIEQRLGRKLQPFDIWYDGFNARSTISADLLERTTCSRYPNAETLERELPNILMQLGFSQPKAQFIAQRVRVETARGAGHAWGAEMRNHDAALLRSRMPLGGMDYKGFNIAMHEFGHTVEQTITLHDVDYYTMHGVPNTAFTEALAFVFQKRDLQVLGLGQGGGDAMANAAATMSNLWGCFEIMGVSLVDIGVWRWLYANPQADAEQLKQAVLRIAKEVWNAHFADVFGQTDVPLLAIYSHMIYYPLYLSAYPIGHLIDFQLEQHFVGRDFAAEVERIFKQGRLDPQLWMQRGVGQPLSVQPLLTAARKAMEQNIE